MSCTFDERYMKRQVRLLYKTNKQIQITGMGTSGIKVPMILCGVVNVYSQICLLSKR